MDNESGKRKSRNEGTADGSKERVLTTRMKPREQDINRARDEYFSQLEELMKRDYSPEEEETEIKVLIRANLLPEAWEQVSSHLSSLMTKDGDLYVTKVSRFVYTHVRSCVYMTVISWKMDGEKSGRISRRDHRRPLMSVDQNFEGAMRQPDCTLFSSFRDGSKPLLMIEVEERGRGLLKMYEIARDAYFTKESMQVVVVIKLYPPCATELPLIKFPAVAVMLVRGEGGEIAVTDMVSFGNLPLHEAALQALERLPKTGGAELRLPPGGNSLPDMRKDDTYEDLKKITPWELSLNVPGSLIDAPDLRIPLWKPFADAVQQQANDLAPDEPACRVGRW